MPIVAAEGNDELSMPAPSSKCREIEESINICEAQQHQQQQLRQVKLFRLLQCRLLCHLRVRTMQRSGHRHILRSLMLNASKQHFK